MSTPAVRQQLQQRIAAFDTLPLRDAATGLLQTLAYSSPRRISINTNKPEEFISLFAKDGYDQGQLLLEEWQSFDFIFQLTSEEIRISSQSEFIFESSTAVDRMNERSYLFFVIELKAPEKRPGKRKDATYSRSELSGITREVNKLFRQPAMLIFKHGSTLTISVINRRLHKRDGSKDVLEKVTLIKDIRTQSPHSAHIQILADLHLHDLFRRFEFRDFEGLHDSWRKTLDTSELNKRFYAELANWYFWALEHAEFPSEAEKDKDDRDSISIIRMLTRFVFCWFLKEKELLPSELFDAHKVNRLVTLEPEENSYYTAILQNLFFATLNTEMDEPGKKPSRHFIDEDHEKSSSDEHMVHTVWRYKSRVKDVPLFETLMRGIPFLNGGLFECLDERVKHGSGTREIRIDGFSTKSAKQPKVPNMLFFGDEVHADLSRAYGEPRYRNSKVWPLISLLHRYKFTVAENTPLEEEVALDPELLGHVFENLLAMYNPETDQVARKTTGSFYTPRVVVDFMVDEALLVYLSGKLTNSGNDKTADERLRRLLDYQDPGHDFTCEETIKLLDAIDNVRILDPACGSGAFPMGTLHKLVALLKKLDPDNRGWQQRQIAKARQLDVGREAAIEAVNDAFRKDRGDYGRKLFLIENCLFGVDIQPIAVQISKLRFFISLVVDQDPDELRPNRGITPLPNLETNLIAANTLVKIHKTGDAADEDFFLDPEVERAQQEIQLVRHEHFRARGYRDKKALRKRDRELRDELSALLAGSFAPHESDVVARWDPYHPDVSAPFFDAQWMFNLTPSKSGGAQHPDGFDICIANPPYVRQEQVKRMMAFKDVPKLKRPLKELLKDNYYTYTGVADLYVYFYERAMDLLVPGGVLCFISSNKYFRAAYGEKLRQLMAGAAEVRLVIDFGDTPVFTAIAYPSIVVARKTRETRNKSALADALSNKRKWADIVPKKATVRMLNWQPEAKEPIEEFPLKVLTESMVMPQVELQPDGWRLESPETLRLLEKLRNAGPTLADYVEGRFYRGILTGLNDAFIVSRETRDHLIKEHESSNELLKPFLRGRDVKRWQVDFADQYLIKIESSENATHPWTGKSVAEAERIFARTYPAIFKWFEPKKHDLKKRCDQGHFYFELRSCAYWKTFEQPKIVIAAITDVPNYAVDRDGYFSNDKTSICVEENLEVLCALLNSSTLFWFIKKIAATKQGGFLEFKPMYVQLLPIVKCTKEAVREIAKITKTIQDLKRKDPKVFIGNEEAELDALVAHQYGLTDVEYSLVLTQLLLAEPVRVQCENRFRHLARR